MIKLDVKTNRELELKIINLTEELIQDIIKANPKDEAEKNLILEDAQNLILRLSELIHTLVQDEDHLESMLNQLIMQKLPDDYELDDFEDFEEVLSELIQESVNKYRSNLHGNQFENTPEEQILDHQENIYRDAKVDDTQEDEQEIDDDQESDELIIQIKKLIPGITVEKNVHYKGIKLQYYIPEMKVVIELQEHKKEELKQIKGLKDLIAAKDGMKLVKISPDCSLTKLKKLINQ